MRNILLLIFLTLLLTSCGSSKSAHRGVNSGNISQTAIIKTQSRNKPVRKVNSRIDNNSAENETEEIEEIIAKNSKRLAQDIIDYAKTFEGTRYKFGGNTDAGMDCSGLVCVAFEKENIKLPRISREIATQGVSISIKDIEEGDLVFFKTSRKYAINHVGIVVEKKRGEVMFIHSSTSAGVIISSLDEAYWKKAFVEVRRII